MPYVSCPTCGERGKIPTGLIGVRIKCKQCGLSFLVAPPATKAVGAAAPPRRPRPRRWPRPARRRPSRPTGSRSRAWTPPPGPCPPRRPWPSRPRPTTPPTPTQPEPQAASGIRRGRPARRPAREYKILTPRDKFFDGKFDLGRLEEALNHFGRQGWVAKSMLTPHIKGFTGALEETIVVLLERCKEGA